MTEDREKVNTTAMSVLAGIGFFGSSLFEALPIDFFSLNRSRCRSERARQMICFCGQVLCLVRYSDNPCLAICMACMGTWGCRSQQREQQRLLCIIVLLSFFYLTSHSATKVDPKEVAMLVTGAASVGLESYALLKLRSVMGSKGAHKTCRLPRVAICAVAALCSMYFFEMGRLDLYAGIYCFFHMAFLAARMNWEYSWLDLSTGQTTLTLTLTLLL